MLIKKKIPYIISFFIFAIPILAFLNKINLPQVTALEVYLISFSQFSFFIIMLLLSYFIHSLFLKKKIEFKIFFLSNSFIAFLLLFFQNIKSLLFFESQNFIFDEIFALLIFVLAYLFLIKFAQKNFNLICRFLIIFIFLQFLLFIYNLIIINANLDSQITIEKKENIASNLDSLSISENKDKANIFFIVFDGMMTLESAEKLKIIRNKDETINSLKKNNINYKENFLANYDSTYLSLASLLEGTYPVTEDSKKYRTRKNYFPFFLMDQKKDNDFFKILRKTNKKFFWLGNSNSSCLNNIYVDCVGENRNLKFISIVSLFYYDSVYIYLFNKMLGQYDNRYESIDFLVNPKKEFKGNEIYLLHILNPHPPYYLNKNCEIKNDLMKNLKTNEMKVKYYGYAYNCLLNMAQVFTNKISKINEKNLIFIMGDHGWSFDKKIMEKNNLEKSDNRFKTFFAYRVPSSCKELSTPNSIVNTIRYALNCSENSNLNYLKDLQFKSFPEGHKDYGKVFLRK